jgi:hypothetical protein
LRLLALSGCAFSLTHTFTEDQTESLPFWQYFLVRVARIIILLDDLWEEHHCVPLYYIFRFVDWVSYHLVEDFLLYLGFSKSELGR